MEKVFVTAFLLLSIFQLFGQQTTKYKDIKFNFSNDVLTVSNDKISRTWQWTEYGLVTTSVKNLETGKEWCESNEHAVADWSIPEIEKLPAAELIQLVAIESDDEGFTTSHLEVVAEVYYPTISTTIKYVVWAYPNSSGLRTQLFVKSDRSFFKETFSSGIPQNEISIVNHVGSNSPTENVENILDGNIKTLWRSKITGEKPVAPNQIVFDLGKERLLNGLAITQIQTYRVQGNIEKCLVYASNDTTNWGVPVGNGNLCRATYPQYVNIQPKKARYVKLVIPQTTIVNTPSWQNSMAEINIFTSDSPFTPKQNELADFYPINASSYKRRAIGYNGDTQWRNTLTLPFYREEINNASIQDIEIWDWCNILSIEDGDEGLCFVKESHKTAIQQGHKTGEFICSKNGIQLTGWGIARDEITNDYRKCWANWCIVYQGGDDEREQAIKKFDRCRFPTNLPGHKEIYACSWGFGNKPGAGGYEKRQGGIESNVLKEMEASAEMGIEVYLIDDGWQLEPYTKGGSMPPNEIGWKPHPDNYPDEWKNVVAKGKKLNIKPALWTAVQPISLNELNYNQEKGNFLSWKFDFAVLKDYQTREAVENKARTFIKQQNYNVSINWDLTEIMPRYGFFWAREYGIIWLANKEPHLHTLYTPSVMLRDAWDLSRYLNLNKFQLTIRNVDSIAPPSDAFLYNQSYAVAIGMAGIPMFFEKMQSYSLKARKEVRETIDLFKPERKTYLESYVYPIGGRPSNKSFTGFQAVYSEGDTGYILLFRELYSVNSQKEIALKFIKNKRLKLYNLKTKEERVVEIGENGIVTFRIENPADFAFFKYKIQN